MGMVSRIMAWYYRHHRPPPHSNAPPVATFIRRLDLHIHYFNLLGEIIEMATASLTWTVPATRTDGSALPPDQIASIAIFDTAAANPTVPIATTVGAAASFTTNVLSVGVHNFTVVVNDTTGHASAASNVASVTVPAVLANPSAVTDLAATLNA